MLVVSDASLLRYLILVGFVDVLPKLFGRVVTPPEVITGGVEGDIQIVFQRSGNLDKFAQTHRLSVTVSKVEGDILISRGTAKNGPLLTKPDSADGIAQTAQVSGGNLNGAFASPMNGAFASPSSVIK